MFYATHPGILTSARSTSPYGLASQLEQNAPLPPQSLGLRSAASVLGLSPVYCRRETTRPVSYYALFKGWLLLSQPPGCPGGLTSFPT